MISDDSTAIGLADDDQVDPVEIPYGQLNEDLLHRVLESFILREGTDYGEVELTLEQKVAKLKRQYQRGDVRLHFDPRSESVNFLAK